MNLGRFKWIGLLLLVITVCSIYININSKKKISIDHSKDILTDYKQHLQSATKHEHYHQIIRGEADIKMCSLNEEAKLKSNISLNYFENNKEVRMYIQSKCQKVVQRECQLYLIGPINVNQHPLTLEELSNDLPHPMAVNMGGWYQPKTCNERRRVSIIIPFRNREEHLPILLRHMHPILQRQQLHYRIFVIEQADKYEFNRGKLMNVGYKESQKFFPYDCVVFHDVDLLPEDDRNSFDCSSSPQHMCAALDKFKYKLIYEELFGGVEMFTKDHYELVNGFSNAFWGWGAEDDNLYRRLKWKNLTLWRPPLYLSKYKMIKHKDEEPNADKKRFEVRKESLQHFATDGLINLQYEVLSITEEKLFTRIKVNLRKYKDKLFGVREMPS